VDWPYPRLWYREPEAKAAVFVDGSFTSGRLSAQERLARLIRLLVILLVIVAVLVASTWWQANQRHLAAQDAAKLRRDLTAATKSVGDAELTAAATQAQLGDYRLADALTPPAYRQRTTASDGRLVIDYQSDLHHPFHCFALILSVDGSTVDDQGGC
jgi:hypothetical protein